MSFLDDARDAIEGEICRGCGCSDAFACPGGCVWVEPDLCSRCAIAVGDPDKHLGFDGDEEDALDPGLFR